MKIENFKYGWNQYYRPLPKPVKTLITCLKGLLGFIATSQVVIEGKPIIGFWILFAGAVLDQILNFFAEAPEYTIEKTAERLERDKPELDVKVLVNEKN